MKYTNINVQKHLSQCIKLYLVHYTANNTKITHSLPEKIIISKHLKMILKNHIFKNTHKCAVLNF